MTPKQKSIYYASIAVAGLVIISALIVHVLNVHKLENSVRVLESDLKMYEQYQPYLAALKQIMDSQNQ